VRLSQVRQIHSNYLLLGSTPAVPVPSESWYRDYLVMNILSMPESESVGCFSTSEVLILFQYPSFLSPFIFFIFSSLIFFFWCSKSMCILEI